MCGGAPLWRTGPLLLTNACCRLCRFGYISLICWAHFSDVMVLLHWDSESCSDQTSNGPPQWPWTLVQVWLENCFGASSWPNHWSGHCWLSYTIHFSSNSTIWSRNGSLLLCRIKKDDTSSRWFFDFSVSSWGSYFSSFFTFPGFFKCRMTIVWLSLDM